METFEVTKLGERGQIVIPQEFRKSMGLHAGEKFMVVSREGALIFKRLEAPSLQEFDRMLAMSHAHAKKRKITEKDMWNAIKKTRHDK